jgi:hypothetical protein
MVKIVIKERDPKDPLNKLEGKELQIRTADERSLRVRWDSGTMLRELRDAKWAGVPGGLDGAAKRLGVNRQELQFRMRFAESRQALAHAVSNGWSWHETRNRMTELVGRKRAASKKAAATTSKATTSKATTSPKTASAKDEAPKEPAPKQEATPTEEAPKEQETPERPPKVVPANEVEIRRMKNTLHRTHGDGLTETALKLLDQMVEEIARILDEAGTAKRGAAQ